MTVIRDVKIRVKTEWEKARGEMPGSGGRGGPNNWGLPDDKAYYDQRDAINEAAAAEREKVAVTKEHTKATQEFGSVSFREYAKVGSGVLSLARGMALLSASSSESTKQMLEMFVVIEGGVAVVKGLGAVFNGLAGIIGGPLAIAVTAGATIVTAGALAWNHYKHAAEEAAKKIEEAASNAEKAFSRFNAVSREAQQLETDFQREKINAELTPEGKLAAVKRELNRQQGIQDKEAAAIAGLDAKAAAVGLSKNEQQDWVGAERRRIDALKEEINLLKQAADLSEQQVTGAGNGLFPAAPGQLKGMISDEEIAQTRAIRMEYTKELQSHLDMLKSATEKMRSHELGLEHK